MKRLSLPALAVFVAAALAVRPVLAHGFEPELAVASEASASDETREMQVVLIQEAAVAIAPEAYQPPLVVERGEGHASLPIPRGEELLYSVTVDLGLFDATAGTVTMTSTVEPWQESLLVASEAELGDVGVFTIHAKGKHSWYHLDATIESRILPQEWPRISNRFTQEGSETRRREIQLGVRNGVSRSSYRGDTRHNAPKGQRIWREREYREVPGETIDMLSAVYLSRRMIESGDDEMTFPMVDKLRLYKMRLKRGKTSRVEVDAGVFDCVRLELIPEAWPEVGKVASAEEREKFEGLFGLTGSIVLMVDQATGVPVRIAGDLPAGPFTFEVLIDLKSHKGTPPDFKKVR